MTTAGPDKEEGLAGVRRILAPSGRFVITKDGGISDREQADALERRLTQAGAPLGRNARTAGRGVTLQR